MSISNNDIFAKIKQLDQRCQEVGFVWNEPSQLLDQVKSETKEEVLNLPDKQKELEEELGDLLLATIELCAFVKLDPQNVLQKSVDKFERRFNKVEELMKTQGMSTLKGLTLPELLQVWKQAKKLVG